MISEQHFRLSLIILFILFLGYINKSYCLIPIIFPSLDYLVFSTWYVSGNSCWIECRWFICLWTLSQFHSSQEEINLSFPWLFVKTEGTFYCLKIFGLKFWFLNSATVIYFFMNLKKNNKERYCHYLLSSILCIIIAPQTSLFFGEHRHNFLRHRSKLNLVIKYVVICIMEEQ